MLYLLKERLNFVKERKEKIQETYNPVGIQGTYYDVIYLMCFNIYWLATVNIGHDDVINDDIILPSFDYNRELVPQPAQCHMGNLLDQLDTSIQLRRIAMEAEQVSLYNVQRLCSIELEIAIQLAY